MIHLNLKHLFRSSLSVGRPLGLSLTLLTLQPLVAMEGSVCDCCGSHFAVEETEHDCAAVEVASLNLELPEGLPEQFTLKLPIAGESWTLVLNKNRVYGKNTRFLVSDGIGNLTQIDTPPNCHYLGQIPEQPGFSIVATLESEGLSATILRPGQDPINIEPTSTSEDRSLHTILVETSEDESSDLTFSSSKANVAKPLESSSKPKGDSTVFATKAATQPPGRVMTVYEFEVGVEIGSPAFLNNHGGSITNAQNAAATIPANMDARYLRGAGIKHVLGTVIIRTSAAEDKFNVANGNDGGGLSAFRNYWNANPGEVGNTHDLAVYHVRASPSGLAYVNSVGSSNRYALTASNGPTSWANGTLVHEFGHSWNLRHTSDGPIQEYEVDSGDDPPAVFYESKPRDNGNAAGGAHTFISVMHGSGSRNIGRLSTEEANEVYRILQGKTGFAEVVANPPQVSPFGQMDRVFVPENSSATIDVIANDHDANNDVLDVELKDTVSYLGGSIALSSGTGPGGRNELIYTAPPSVSSGVDFFHYTVRDENGAGDFGAVYVTISSPLLFAESFNYPSGPLAGNTIDGGTWAAAVAAGSADTAFNVAQEVGSVPDLLSMGGSVTQVGSNRQHLPLPTRAHGGADNTVRYISFVQKLSFADAGKSQIVEFWEGSPSSGNTTFSFGTDTNGSAPDYGLLIDKDGGNVARDLGSPDSDAHLIVLKVEYGSSDQDTISVFVDPGTAEPGTADATANYTNLSFDRVGFGSFQGGGQEIDEIRIGSSYESVLPVALSELFFSETFSYPSGELEGEINDGVSWIDERNANNTAVDTSASLVPSSVPGFLSSGGKAAQVQGSSARYSLGLSSDVLTGQDGTVRYISFLQKLDSADIGKTRIVEFSDSPDTSSTSIFSFGTDTNGAAPDYGLLVDKGGAEIPVSAGAASDETRLIVLRVEYGFGNVDSISMYVDPGSSEPAVADGSAFFTDLSFSRIGLGAFQGGNQEVDEIRIGSSYESVVPVLLNPDSDNDGLPDSFEREHYDPDDLTATDGSGDLDRDGQSDAAEFAAGTDANDSSSTFRFAPNGIEPATGQEISLTWYSVPGKVYRVWTSTTLNGDWVPLGENISASAGETTSVDVTENGNVRFYHVRLVTD